MKVLTSCGANVSHRDEDGMSVLEHAEQNDRRQVVGLIKRAQLANQMRQRRKQKNQHKENGMTMEEFLHREEKAKETMVELLQVRSPLCCSSQRCHLHGLGLQSACLVDCRLPWCLCVMHLATTCSC